jgi:hypothetical protein
VGDCSDRTDFFEQAEKEMQTTMDKTKKLNDFIQKNLPRAA